MCVRTYMYIYIYRERERDFKQRVPNPEDNSSIGKDTSTHEGPRSTFAASFSC